MAESYDRLRPVDARWWEVFEALLAAAPLAGRRVVDVGCGTGRLAAALAERGARVWGVDPSPEMVAQARASVGDRVGLRVAPAEALPFKDAWFEGAVLRLVVHLIDRPAAFAELARVLAPGGRVAVATFDPDSLGSFWLARVLPEVVELDRGRFPTAPVLEADLTRAGFRDIGTRRLAQAGRVTRAEALERIRGRYISTLRLLDEEAVAAGLARAEHELPAEVEDRRAWLVLAAERA